MTALSGFRKWGRTRKIRPMPATKTKKATKTVLAEPAKPKRKSRWYKPATKEERKAITAGYKRLPSAPLLFIRTIRLMFENLWLLGGILLVYGLVDLVLVGGNSESTSLPAAKSSLVSLFHGHINNLSAGFTLFSFLSSSGNTANTDAASAYEAVLLLIISVVYIWGLRQVYAKQKVRIRDAFYKGTYALIPFLIVLFVMGIQLLPFVIGAALYSNLLNNGYLVGSGQHAAAVGLFFLLSAWSLYMLCSSLIALYIVTLPDMTPIKALLSARQLVRFRRWVVLRKMIFLVASVAILGTLILIPVALFATPLALVIFLLLTALTVGVIHTFVYGLYREML